jgi:multicomponent Na+:H+ antiporter subunit C
MRAGDLMEWFNGETVSIILFFLGLYGVVARKNIIKTVISIIIMETAVILFFLTINHQEGSIAPIGKGLEGHVADPLPQALMITAIVIGIAITAVALVMANTIYEKYGTSNWSELMTMRRENEND